MVPVQRISAAVVVLLLLLGGCGGGGNSSGGGSGGGSTPAPPPREALSVRFPIDGQADFSVFDQVQTRTVSLYDQLGGGSKVGSTTVRWGILNDDRDIYIAIQWTDPTYNHSYDSTSGPTDFDGVEIRFDSDNDGAFDHSDDARSVLAASVSSLYLDQHDTTSGVQSDIVGDGFGRLHYDSSTGKYTAEFRFPLKADIHHQDGNLVTGIRYNIVLFDHVQLANGSGNIGTAYSGADTSGWPSLALSSGGTYERPQMPDNLTGLIVFVGDQDVPGNGEIYTYDPATKVIKRVTYMPGLFKDNVSLSHDRTRVAFEGATNKNDLSTYEIYVLDLSTGKVTQLTHNNILDGHPGWSPDDTRIAYVSFRDPKGESVITMTANGQEISNLTPSGMADNDPDYLPDGRIVFKTDRFSAEPQVRIAVMNESGGNVEQLTFGNGFSDHDPVGNNTYAIFERFPKATQYTTDPEAPFVGWNIVETALDGSGTHTVLSDGWVNWLPVFAPGGHYISYLKSTGAYTDIELMTTDGTKIGRLVPNMGQVRYYDWK